LLVENQSSLGRFVGMALMEAGYAVSKVSTPEEVGPMLAPSPPDLIIFNTGLAVEDKSMFIYTWREQVPALKVLEISEEPLIKTGASSIDLATLDAPNAILSIPFTLEELPAKVEALLQNLKH